MYTVEYNMLHKMTCMALDNLYRNSNSFSLDEKLLGWMRIIDLDNPNNFLKIDAKGELCANIWGVELPMHYYGKLVFMRKGKKPTQPKLKVTKEVFKHIVESIMNSMKDISYSISLEIKEIFSQHELLESMCIVFPNYWSLRSPNDFKDKLLVLTDQF